jgi:hypothetical protein
MPAIDAAGTLSVPIWLAGAAAAVFVLAILLAAKRAGGVALFTSLFRVGLIAAVVLGVWLYMQQRDVSERRALDDRKTALMAGSIAPGSALSCLDELAGDAVEAACEKGVFASPEAVAAAVKYVTAQLALLEDGTAYAKRSDASYATTLAPLRTAVELDRFGLVAQVLKEREGCTVDRCDALTRFRESTRVLGNLRDRTFEEQVKKYTAIWNAPRPAGGVVAAAGPSVALPGTNGPGRVTTARTSRPRAGFAIRPGKRHVAAARAAAAAGEPLGTIAGAAAIARSGRGRAGLAIHGGHSPGRAGKRHVATSGAAAIAGERHASAARRRTRLAIRGGHSPGRAGERHAFAAAAAASGAHAAACGRTTLRLLTYRFTAACR